jgi:hypothetical protein
MARFIPQYNVRNVDGDLLGIVYELGGRWRWGLVDGEHGILDAPYLGLDCILELSGYASTRKQAEDAVLEAWRKRMIG